MAIEHLFLWFELKWRPPRKIRQINFSFKSRAEGISLFSRLWCLPNCNILFWPLLWVLLFLGRSQLQISWEQWKLWTLEDRQLYHQKRIHHNGMNSWKIWTVDIEIMHTSQKFYIGFCVNRGKKVMTGKSSGGLHPEVDARLLSKFEKNGMYWKLQRFRS